MSQVGDDAVKHSEMFSKKQLNELWWKPRVSRALAKSGTGLEGAERNLSFDAAITYLRGQGVEEQLHRLQQILPNQTSDASRDLMTAATQAFSELTHGKNLSAKGLFGLEALILLAGRPVLKTINGDINLDDPQASEWRDKLYLAQRPPSDLSQRIAAVGRIDQDGSHIGTGFVVGTGLILTNRHVIEAFAEHVVEDGTWRLNGVVTIDFADAPNSFNPELRFQILKIVAANVHPIDRLHNNGFADLDAAILEVELVNSAGNSLPQPIPLSQSENILGAINELLVIGYPAHPSRLPRSADGTIDNAVVIRLGELFNQYGVRTVAPGMPKWSEAFNKGWVFPHDATTLGGSSGSCVLSFDGHGVGLHFGGIWRHANYAHGLARVRATGTFLKDPKLMWTDQ